MQERPKISPKNKLSQSLIETAGTNEDKDTDKVEGNIVIQSNNIKQDGSDINSQLEKQGYIKPRPKLGNIQARGNGIVRTDLNQNIEVRNAHLPLTKKHKLKFEDKYHRLSTFLENGLYDKVIELKEQGYIESIVQLVNDALKQYLNIK